MSETSKAMMRAVEAGGFGLDKLRLVECPVPRPGAGEVLVWLNAATLNYRDVAILKGSYKPELKPPFVPGSDAAGTVVEAGRSSERLSGLLDEGGEVFDVPPRPFPPVFQAEGRLCLPEQVERHVLDHGHVRGAVACPEPGQIVAAKPEGFAPGTSRQVPNAGCSRSPMAAHHAGEGFSIELGRAKVAAPLASDPAVAVGLAFDHADHGQARKRRFAREAAAGKQPAYVMARVARAGFQPAVRAFRGSMRADCHRGRWRGEQGLDLGAQAGLVLLECEHVVPRRPRE